MHVLIWCCRNPNIHPGCMQDSAELAWRQRAHAHLRPACLAESWGSHIRQPAATNNAALPFGNTGHVSSGVADTHADQEAQQEMQGLLPGAAIASRAQTPLQHALLSPGEV